MTRAESTTAKIAKALLEEFWRRDGVPEIESVEDLCDLSGLDAGDLDQWEIATAFFRNMKRSDAHA